jgi:hypothetical protein
MTRGVKLKFRKGSIVSMNKIEIELPIQYPEYKATNDFEVVIRIIKKRTPLRINKSGHFNRKITATEVPRAMYLISKFENKIKKVK